MTRRARSVLLALFGLAFVFVALPARATTDGIAGHGLLLAQADQQGTSGETAEGDQGAGKKKKAESEGEEEPECD